MLSFRQHKKEVEVLIKNRATEKQYTIKANYMIAADSANSMVRKQLDVPTSGNIAGTDLLNIYFEADLESVINGQESSKSLIDKTTSMFLAMKSTLKEIRINAYWV